jgi:DNA-binding NarL/FixJ family response regulator
MAKPINIMLVEDHPEYREVIEMTLDLEPELLLTSQFGTAEMALRSLQRLETRKIPDIILLDLNLPGMGGLEAIPFFNSAVPDAKIIVLTQSDREADVLKAISLGASGYLLKSSTTKAITAGIHTVVKGGATLDAKVAKFILQTLKTKLPKKEEESPLLSKREQEVLTLLAEGLAKKEIAERLRISTTTIVTHVNHIYEKLNAPNAPAAINKAHRLGLFPDQR